MGAQVFGTEKVKKRELIVQSARRLFLENGFAKTSMNMIQREAGISKGLIYYHFDGKDELAIAVINSILAEEFSQLTRLSSRIGEVSGDKEAVQGVIRGFMSEVLSTTITEVSTTQIFLDLLINMNSSDSKRRVKELYQNYVNKVADFLDALQVENSLIIAKMILVLLDGLSVFVYFLGDELSADDNLKIVDAMMCLTNLG